eukprot:TRINITY_DN4770_c0_g1_i1.p1 TRINITY_DN4770_c0_g1~~TRINITY_DN4770_c0_g1_i1.p1  ORF type:complete len:283 (+),score=72.05 TRINITY_DN4770_c0_g1_i1:40-888(+)
MSMMQAVRFARSALYCPAINKKAMNKALSGVTGADLVIVDLEDSVHPNSKDEARSNILSSLEQWDSKTELVVRINSISNSPWGAKDYSELRLAGLKASELCIPKVEHVEKDLPEEGFWSMVETPTGVLHSQQIAAASTGIIAGTQDLAVEMQSSSGVPVCEDVLFQVLNQVVLAAKSHKIPVLDGVYASYADIEGLTAQSQKAAERGYDGKTCIHPLQIEVVNKMFSPSPEVIKRARDVVAAWEEAVKNDAGIAVLDKQMIEMLHYQNCLNILALVDKKDIK